MYIKVQCRACRSTYRVKPDLAGRVARCGDCGEKFLVPHRSPLVLNDADAVVGTPDADLVIVPKNPQRDFKALSERCAAGSKKRKWRLRLPPARVCLTLGAGLIVLAGLIVALVLSLQSAEKHLAFAPTVEPPPAPAVAPVPKPTPQPTIESASIFSEARTTDAAAAPQTPPTVMPAAPSSPPVDPPAAAPQQPETPPAATPDLSPPASEVPAPVAKADGGFTVIPTTVPSIRVAETLPASQLAAAVAALTKSVERECRGCSGRGTEIVQVQVDTEWVGNLSRPILESQTRECSACGGSGRIRANAETVLRIVSNVVNSIATVRESDAAAPVELQAAYLALATFVCENGSANGARELVSMKARGLLAQQHAATRTIKSATPVAAIGHLLGSAPVPADDNRRAHFVVIAGTEQLVMLTAPRLADNLQPGTAVFCGGLYGGATAASDGRPIHVLQNGFLTRDTSGVDVPLQD